MCPTYFTCYFNRAKKIQNKAIVNESPTDRLIRELKEENARLMAMLKKHGTGDTTGDILTSLYTTINLGPKYLFLPTPLFISLNFKSTGYNIILQNKILLIRHKRKEFNGML
jgi:hypothetical protein